MSKNSATLDLSALQNKCKRDPSGYKDEFLLQLKHFEKQLEIFKINPKESLKNFQEQISFLSHVAEKYPKETKEFPQQLIQLFESCGHMLDFHLRKCLTTNIILLRNRNMLTAAQVFNLAFKLFKVEDKNNRKLLYAHLVNNTKGINDKAKNYKLNSELQTIVLKNLSNDSDEQASRHAIKLLIDLYNKNVWRDSKVVNIISQGVFSKQTKILSAALRFFLSDTGEKAESDEEEPESSVSVKQIRKEWAKKNAHSTKTRSKKRKLTKLINQAKAKSKKEKESNPNFPALEMLNDPQAYTEKVFKMLRGSTEIFEMRLMIMNFISRLIAVHQLLVFPFYAFIQNYLQPKQLNVTYILAILAQSCHELIPADTLEPILKLIADQFVSDRSSEDVVAIGLNSIREICVRCPLAMSPELLEDLIQYRKSRDKGVVMAARSLFNYFKATNPMLLPRKERGGMTKENKNMKPLAYGEQKIFSTEEQIALIQKHGDDSGEESDSWQEVSDDDENMSGSWQDLSDDEEGEGSWHDVMSDSSEEWDSDEWEEVKPKVNRASLKKLSLSLSKKKKPAPELETMSIEELKKLQNQPKESLVQKKRKVEQVESNKQVNENKNKNKNNSKNNHSKNKNENDRDELLEFSIDRTGKRPEENIQLGKELTTKFVEENENATSEDDSKDQAEEEGGKVLTTRQLEKLERLARHEDSSSNSEDEDRTFVDPKALESGKRKKQTYEERAEHRAQDRQEYVSWRKKKVEENGPTTNYLKKKMTKNWKMVSQKRSVRSKLTRSSKEKAKIRKKHSETIRNRKLYKH